MITYQPTMAPGMQAGEQAYTVRVGNDDGSEKEMFNIIFSSSVDQATGNVSVSARRIDNRAVSIKEAVGAGVTLGDAIVAVANELITTPDVPVQAIDATRTSS